MLDRRTRNALSLIALTHVVSACTLGPGIASHAPNRAPAHGDTPAGEGEGSSALGEGEGSSAIGEGEGEGALGEGEGSSAIGEGEGEGEGSASIGEGEGEGASSIASVLPPSTTTKGALLANNTSAADNFADLYEPASRFNASGVRSNEDAHIGQASTSDMATGLVSKLSIPALIGGGRVFVETQTWFCTNGNGVDPIPQSAPNDQCKSHIDVGYHSNFRAHVKRQVDDMLSRGISGVIMDWAGSAAGTGSIDDANASSSAVVAGSVIAFRDEAETRNGAFNFAVLYDEKTCASQSSCNVTTQIVNDIAFANTHYFSSPAYLKTSDGRPILFFFSVDAWASRYGKSIDWATVRAQAAGNPVFVFENAGGFTHASSDGAFSWVSPHAVANGPGSDPFGTQGFLPYYYQQTSSHASKMSWSSAFKGFDDALVNGWGSGTRIAGQQCGKTWLDTLALAQQHASDVDGVQLVTWDDYEEGTELETGIDNHLALGVSLDDAGVLHWSTAVDDSAPDDCTQAIANGFDVTDTLDHFAVYASDDDNNLSLIADNIAPSTRAFDVSSFASQAPSSRSFFVYAVGKASIHNHLASVNVTNASSSSSSSSCAVPVILEPTPNQNVGPAIHLRVGADACASSLHVTIDGVDAVDVNASTITQWVSVSMGPHTLHVRATTAGGESVDAADLAFTRTY